MIPNNPQKQYNYGHACSVATTMYMYSVQILGNAVSFEKQTAFYAVSCFFSPKNEQSFGGTVSFQIKLTRLQADLFTDFMILSIL